MCEVTECKGIKLVDVGVSTSAELTIGAAEYDIPFARAIVHNRMDCVQAENHITVIGLSERALRFLHLQDQCYMDCLLCFKESMNTEV
jgi:hypothetical protein